MCRLSLHALARAETGDCTDKGRFRRERPFIERHETEE